MRRFVSIFLFALTILLATVAAPTTPARADQYNTSCLADRVTIAKDVNFRGEVYHLTAGTSWSTMPSGWNDVVSSFCVPYGMGAVLYEHSNFGGRAYRVEARNYSVGVNLFNGDGWFNDKTSSLVVFWL